MFTHALTGLQRLHSESETYRTAVVLSLLGAALDGWLSPAVIANSPATGELNPLSLYHGTDPTTFALLRVALVAVFVAALGLAVARSEANRWSDAPLACCAIGNATIGALAGASALAALSTGAVEPANLLGPSLLAVAAAATAALAYRSPRLTVPILINSNA